MKAQAVSGETKKRELARILAAYERGDIDVLVNAQLLAEGWNSPRATVCMHLAPTASKRIYQQRVGRVTRRQPGKEAGIVVDFVHPATKHDDPVVTLHSLLDRDVYRGGAIVVGPVRRGRGRRLRVERRVVPVTADENRRIEVFERELWRIAVEHLDYGEQVQWAALAGARVAPAGWRRARAMLHFDEGGELKRAFLLTAVDRNKNPQLRIRALQEIAAARDAEAFDRAIEMVAAWPRDEKREGVKVVLQALAEKKIGRRDQANNWIWACAEMTREVHEEYAVQRWPETKRLLGLLVNSSGGAHARNARRLVHAARQQDRRLAAALLAAALPHTAEAGEVINGARTRMSRKPAALARELLRNFPKGKGRRGQRRRKKGKAGESQVPAEAVRGGGVRRGRGRAEARELEAPARAEARRGSGSRRRRGGGARRGASRRAEERRSRSARRAAAPKRRSRREAPRADAPTPDASRRRDAPAEKPKRAPRKRAPKPRPPTRPAADAPAEKPKRAPRKRAPAKPKGGEANGAPDAARARLRARARGRPGQPARTKPPSSATNVTSMGWWPIEADTRRARCTSPADSTVSPPSASRTRSPPSSSIPSPTPAPPSQRSSAPSSASRSRSAVSVAAAGSPSRRSSAASSSASTASTSGRPSATAPTPSGAAATLTPIPTTAQPSLRAALDEHARDLAAVEQHVVGPLHARGGARDVGDRQPGAQRQQRVELAHDQRAQQRGALRRLPGPALAAAPGGLRAGGHERAVRRPGRGELARAAVRRVDLAQVQPRAAEAAHDGVEPELVAGRDAAQLRRGLAAVDGEREHAGGVLVEQQLAGLGVGERAQVAGAAAVAADRRPDGRCAGLEVAGGGVELHVAEAVDDHRVDDELALLAALARLRELDPDELVGVERRAGVGERLPAGEAGGDGREQVAAVERGRHGLEPPRRRRDLDRLGDPAEAVGRGQQQAVVGADEDAVVERGAQRDGAPPRADLRVDDREVHAGRRVGQRPREHQRAGEHGLARDAVGEVDHARGRALVRDHGVHDADELVRQPVVGEEGDGSRHAPTFSRRPVPRPPVRRACAGRPRGRARGRGRAARRSWRARSRRAAVRQRRRRRRRAGGGRSRRR